MVMARSNDTKAAWKLGKGFQAAGIAVGILKHACDFGVARSDNGEIAIDFVWMENFGLINGIIAADFQAAIEQSLQALYAQKIACANNKDAIACFVGGVD